MTCNLALYKISQDVLINPHYGPTGQIRKLELGPSLLCCLPLRQVGFVGRTLLWVRPCANPAHCPLIPWPNVSVAPKGDMGDKDAVACVPGRNDVWSTAELTHFFEEGCPMKTLSCSLQDAYGISLCFQLCITPAWCELRVCTSPLDVSHSSLHI